MIPCSTTVVEDNGCGFDAALDASDYSAYAFRESGSQRLAIGQVVVDVTFGVAKSNASYSFTRLYVENDADANPAVIGAVVTNKTINGFRALFNSSPETSNYIFQWAVEI